KLKRMESDNAGLAAAMFSYQDRYLQLPGDDSDAAGRFDVYASLAGADGGGDGVIGAGDDWDTVDASTGWAAGATQESSKFFGHLRAAGLIPGGSGTDPTRPTNAYGGLIGLQNGSLSMAGHAVIFGQIEGTIARILEARLDDGDTGTGRMRGNVSSAGDMDAGTTPPTGAYADANRYDLAFRL
ncbi:MAG: hypothetical protein AAF353_18650, partial [Pseudomonadota bacterium]